jgi:hypothetical protein
MAAFGRLDLPVGRHQAHGVDRLTSAFIVATINMHLAFDPAKDAGNQAKHGVSLSLAGELDWEAALVWVDERFGYNELRMIALAPETNVRTTWRL